MGIHGTSMVPPKCWVVVAALEPLEPLEILPVRRCRFGGLSVPASTTASFLFPQAESLNQSLKIRFDQARITHACSALASRVVAADVALCRWLAGSPGWDASLCEFDAARWLS
jgi:hypothetical protein